MTGDDAAPAVDYRTPPAVIVHMALRHVADGYVALYGKQWLDRGRRMSSALTPAFDSAYAAGQITVAAPDATQAGMRRAALSPAGWDQYRALGALLAASGPAARARGDADAGPGEPHPQSD